MDMDRRDALRMLWIRPVARDDVRTPRSDPYVYLTTRSCRCDLRVTTGSHHALLCFDVVVV